MEPKESIAKAPTEEMGRGFWNNFWAGHSPREWSYLDRRIFEVLQAEVFAHNPIWDFQRLKVLEAGCGTGGISMLLMRKGAEASLLDISDKAVALAKRTLGEQGAEVIISQSSIFAIPHPEGTFDLVWNAGVIEHFDRGRQVQALREMSRVCRSGGLVVLLNPYEKSHLYRFGKYLLERTNLWPYGRENPIGTLAPIAQEVGSIRLRREYSVAFFHILIGAFALIPGLSAITRWLNRAVHALYRFALGGGVARTDRWLSDIFGGYLLVSVLEKR